MSGQKNRRSKLLTKIYDVFPDRTPGRRVEPDGWFIQEKNGRWWSIDWAISSRRIMPPE